MVRTRKAPKDIEKYLSPRLAYGRLAHLALEQILFLKKSVKVKWELKLHYYHTPEFIAENPGIEVLPTSGTFSSGDNEQGFE